MSTEHPKFASAVTSTKINLLTQNQASAYVTQNVLNVIIGLFAGGIQVQDRDILATPGAPTNGQAWIIAATGSLTGQWLTDGATNGDIAIYWNGWYYVTPDNSTAINAFIYDEKAWWSWNPNEQDWHPVQDLWITTEHWTGRYSPLSGGKIYSKTVDFGAFPNTTTKTVAHNIVTIDPDGFARYETSVVDDTADIVHGQPPWLLSGGTFFTEMTIGATNIEVVTNYNGTTINMIVRIEYEKV